MPDSDKSLDILIRFITQTQGADAAKEAMTQLKAEAVKAGEEGGKATEELGKKSEEAAGKTKLFAGESRELNKVIGETKREAPVADRATDAAREPGREKSDGNNLNIPAGFFAQDAKITDILKAAADAKAANDKDLIDALKKLLDTQQELQRALDEIKRFNTNGR